MKKPQLQLITLADANHRITPRKPKIKPNVWTGAALMLIGILMLWRSIVILVTGESFIGSFTNFIILSCVVAAYMLARNNKSVCAWVNRLDGGGDKPELTYMYMPQNRPGKQSANGWDVCAGINAIVATHEIQKSEEIRAWMERIRENEEGKNA